MAGQKARSGANVQEITLRAQAMVKKYKLLEVVAKIARAEIEEEYVTKDGVVVSGATKNADRLNAIKLLCAYGFGQPAQKVDVKSNQPILILGSP